MAYHGMTERKNLVAAGILVVGFLLLFLLDREWSDSQFEEASLTTRITGRQLQATLQSCLAPRIEAVTLVAESDWDFSGEIVSEWNALVYPVVSLLPGIQAINFINPDRVITHIYPLETNLSALGANLGQSEYETVVESLRRAEETGRAVRTEPVELLQDGMGFAVYKSIRNDSGDLLGFANGVYRIDDLVDICISQQEFDADFMLVLRRGDGNIIYQGGVAAEDTVERLRVTWPVEVADRPWQFDLQPSRSLAEGASEDIEDIWLASGFLGLIMLSMISRSLVGKRESLARSREQYRMLVEQQTDLVIKVDAQWKFLYVSPSTCRLLGKPEEALLGRHIWKFVHEEDRSMVEEEIQLLSPENPNIYIQSRANTALGLRWIDWSKTALFDNEGNVETINAVGRDITETKKLQAQVAQNQKMQAVAELASGLTHDFNNLLHITLANVELLQGEIEDDSAQESLARIYAAVQSGMNLSSKLSSLSREGSTTSERFPLRDLVEETAGLFGNSNFRNIRIHCELGEEPLYILADRVQIERVIINLLLNARDAITDKGRIFLRLDRQRPTEEFCEAHEFLNRGDYAVLSIEDNGRGITERQLERIFDPFFTSSSNASNTGLGLANSYSIILQHHGSIEADSVAGEGATFTIYLPLIDNTDD